MDIVPCRLVPSTRVLLEKALDALMDRPPLHHSTVRLLRTFATSDMDHKAVLSRLSGLVVSRENSIGVMAHIYTCLDAFPASCQQECNVVRAAVVNEAIDLREERLNDDVTHYWSLVANAIPKHCEYLLENIDLKETQNGLRIAEYARIVELATASSNPQLMELLDVHSVLDNTKIVLRKNLVESSKRRLMRNLVCLVVHGRTEALELVHQFHDGKSMTATFDWMGANARLLEDEELCNEKVMNGLVTDVVRGAYLSQHSTELDEFRQVFEKHDRGLSVLQAASARLVEGGMADPASSNDVVANAASLATTEEHVGFYESRLKDISKNYTLQPIHTVSMLQARCRVSPNNDDALATSLSLLEEVNSPLQRVDSSWDGQSLTHLAELCKMHPQLDERFGSACRAVIREHWDCGAFSHKLRSQAEKVL